MDDPVKYMMDRFNGKLEEDANMKAEIAGISRVVRIDLDGEVTTLLMDENGLNLHTDNNAEPNISVTTSKQVLGDIIEKKLDPFKAYAEGMIKIDASMMDMLKARKFLGS